MRWSWPTPFGSGGQTDTADGLLSGPRAILEPDPRPRSCWSRLVRGDLDWTVSSIITTDDQYDALRDRAAGVAQKVGLAVLVALVACVCAGAAVVTASLRPTGVRLDARTDDMVSAAVQVALDRAHANGRLGSQPVDVSETGAPTPELKLQQLAPETAYEVNARIPVSSQRSPPALPFVLNDGSAVDQARALDCLTAAVYYEAASESEIGQRAVAQVVLNRMRHHAYPKSVCAVVFQGSSQSTGCQFTFACDGSLKRKPNPVLWARAQRVAEAALNGSVLAAVGNATHYHTVWVAPYWSPGLVKIARIGAHVFYRWDGSWGAPRAFAGQYAGDEASAMPVKAGGLATPIAVHTADTELVTRVDATPSQTIQIAAATARPVLVAAAPAPTLIAANTISGPSRPMKLAVPSGW